MGTVVFMHGMGHDQNREYWKAWGEKLLPHLIQRGLDPSYIQFNGIYYYDLVPQPGEGWQRLSSIFKRNVLSHFKQELWEHMVRGGNPTLFLGRGPLEALVNLVVDNFGDIFSYLLDDETHQRVNNRFYAVLKQVPGPVTLVAYSLGSMVAFCALPKSSQPVEKLKHFITLGSPIFWFRKWLSQRVVLSKRPTLAHWTNLAGRMDVACPHLVGFSTCGADSNIECELEKYNPVKGHLAYFSDPEALALLASAVVKQWH
ncbi:hypothetical protein Dred_2448 [Desulforamulus reducens MI-1]|uniref:AB hydrolase-1 domain-containing protein n=1 Tax=Desulforamulus reducens (strain ATCC BAA-1160 / DSM 100696 / MI-1) TaxID=349161 RepID=A4J7A5_DESRM|nr:hypothetical protein [Desulforamulus reducens]ABO50958.1 hypothetical protein Dred_2448 [Desulforamulus reducens MI-1]